MDEDELKHIKKDITEMFLWEESETLAKSVASKLDIGVDDVLFTVNCQRYDEVNTANSILGMTSFMCDLPICTFYLQTDTNV